MERLKDINWNHLYCFYEVARAQSIKQGAKVLGTAPSTISEQIKKLEENFSQKLFHRSSKGLSLTIDGQKLFDRTRNIFEEGSKLLEEVSEGTIGGYPVRIGIDDTISYDLANEFASQYWDYYTMYGTVNTIRQEEHNVLVDNVLKGNIDWGISVQKPKRKNVDFAEIGSFDLVFCCANDLYKKFKNKEDILINIPFAENSWDINLSKLIAVHLRKSGIVPREKIFSDHSGFIKKLCKRGRCVMCIPENPLEKDEDFKTFKLKDPLRISLYAIWRKADENLVSIQKLKELISSKLTHTPFRYKDIDLQIEVSEVSDELLRKKSK